jgi:glycosyltransferase involved in cell wall biosynthesis
MSKVYDCFIFFNELELLELRFRYLWNVVDYFVIVESNKTHSGKDKPYYFEENRDRFLWAEGKISYIKISPNTDGFVFNKKNEFNAVLDDYWRMEFNQRNSIEIGIKDAKDDDIIIVSDVDEIPKREQIFNYKKNNKVDALSFKIITHNYYFNFRAKPPNQTTWGSVITRKKNIKTIQDLRNLRGGLPLTSNVESGGWHFSFLGDKKRIAEKLSSFAHSEYSNWEYVDEKKIEESILNRKYHLGNADIEFEVVDIYNNREDFPDVLVNNQHLFKDFIYNIDNKIKENDMAPIKPTICLNMIVKNESKNILRCLNSLKDYIDYWVISDTGSTDGTQEIINDFFEEHGILGELHHNEWVNYGHNRNLALINARGKCEYILLCDADMELVVKNPDAFKNLSKLDADYIYLWQEGGGLLYQNVRLIDGRKNYSYEGVTHEALVSNFTGSKSNSIAKDDIYYIDHQDGSNRKDKFVRDIELLIKGLEDEPDNTRYMFYLAQSYFDIGDFSNSYMWYKKRADAGGWVEEVQYSLYRCAQCLERMGGADPKKKLEGFPHFLWINLNRMDGRKREMEERLTAYGIKNTRIEAIDGMEVGLDDHFNDFQKKSLAVLPSYLRAVKYYLDNYETIGGVCAIGEDDLLFDNVVNWGESFSDYMKIYDGLDWDVIQLHTGIDDRENPQTNKSPLNYFEENFDIKTPYCRVVDGKPNPGVGTGMGVFLITIDYAIRLLERYKINNDEDLLKYLNNFNDKEYRDSHKEKTSNDDDGVIYNEKTYVLPLFFTDTKDSAFKENEDIWGGLGWQKVLKEKLLNIMMPQYKRGYYTQNIIDAYLTAFNYRPVRIEPLHSLLCYLNYNQIYGIVDELVLNRIVVEPPPQDILFIYSWVYDYAYYDEAALYLFYSGFKKEAGKIWKRMLNEEKYPEHYHNRLVQNLSFVEDLNVGVQISGNKKPILCYFLGYTHNYLDSDYGCYGSELATIKLSEKFTKDYDVYVFGTSFNHIVKNGVTYKHSDDLQEFSKNNQIDVLIVSRYIYYFLEFSVDEINARKTYLWLHDVSVQPYWNGNALPHDGKPLLNNISSKIDGVIVLSNWHLNNLHNNFGVPKEKLKIIGHGINPEKFQKSVVKKKNSFIWFSHPDRGLINFIDFFPRVRESIPDAVLHIYGGIEWFEKNNYDIYQKTNEFIEYNGKVSNDVLITRLLEMDYFVYAANFYETYCIAALEAQAAGCMCIATDMGALTDSLDGGKRGVLIQNRYGTQEYWDELLESIMIVHRDNEMKNLFIDTAKSWALSQSWDDISKQFINYFNKNTLD